MGVGLFAKHDVEPMEMVFSERPLLVFPPRLTFVGRLSPEEAMVHQTSAYDETLKRALRAMTKEDVDAYMGLSNCHPNLPQVVGISSTNSFRTDIEEEDVEEGKFGYCVIGKLASRINHRYEV